MSGGAHHRAVREPAPLGTHLARSGETFGAERRASASREISKLHEETLRGTLAELLEHFGRTEPRGEFVVVVGGAE